MPNNPEGVRFFEHIVAVFSGTKRRKNSVKVDPEASQPFQAGRDPRLLGAVLTKNFDERGWTPFVARAAVLANWTDIVGVDVAAHTKPTLEDDVLIVSCDSSAWATQLRMLRHEIEHEIIEHFPDCGIERVDVLGPGAPNQIRGPRSVKWRGPRDTYG
jgi:hypothetical protein